MTCDQAKILGHIGALWHVTSQQFEMQQYYTIDILAAAIDKYTFISESCSPQDPTAYREYCTILIYLCKI